MWVDCAMELPIDDALMEDGSVSCCRQYGGHETFRVHTTHRPQVCRIVCQSWLPTWSHQHSTWDRCKLITYVINKNLIYILYRPCTFHVPHGRYSADNIMGFLICLFFVFNLHIEFRCGYVCVFGCILISMIPALTILIYFC